jgi:hypothetical protein
MSRLIDTLLKTSQTAPQPMGFRTARQAESVPKILLVAGLDPEAKEVSADYLAGATAALIRQGKSQTTAEAIGTMTANLPGIPWGVCLEGSDEKVATELIDAGCDFLIIPSAGLVSAVPDNDDVGKILQVESSLKDTLLRTLNNLPVDAVFTSDIYQSGEPVNWDHIISIKRMTSLLNKPLLVPISIKTTESELKALREAGVEGAVADIEPGKPDGIKQLRELIDKLPPPSTRKHGKTEAILPRIGGGAGEETPEKEDDEEYE